MGRGDTNDGCGDFDDVTTELDRLNVRLFVAQQKLLMMPRSERALRAKQRKEVENIEARIADKREDLMKLPQDMRPKSASRVRKKEEPAMDSKAGRRAKSVARARARAEALQEELQTKQQEEKEVSLGPQLSKPTQEVEVVTSHTRSKSPSLRHPVPGATAVQPTAGLATSSTSNPKSTGQGNVFPTWDNQMGAVTGVITGAEYNVDRGAGDSAYSGHSSDRSMSSAGEHAEQPEQLREGEKKKRYGGRASSLDAHSLAHMAPTAPGDEGGEDKGPSLFKSDPVNPFVEEITQQELLERKAARRAQSVGRARARAMALKGGATDTRTVSAMLPSSVAPSAVLGGGQKGIPSQKIPSRTDRLSVRERPPRGDPASRGEGRTRSSSSTRRGHRRTASNSSRGSQGSQDGAEGAQVKERKHRRTASTSSRGSQESTQDETDEEPSKSSLLSLVSPLMTQEEPEPSKESKPTKLSLVSPPDRTKPPTPDRTKSPTKTRRPRGAGFINNPFADAMERSKSAPRQRGRARAKSAERKAEDEAPLRITAGTAQGHETARGALGSAVQHAASNPLEAAANNPFAQEEPGPLQSGALDPFDEFFASPAQASENPFAENSPDDKDAVHNPFAGGMSPTSPVPHASDTFASCRMAKNNPFQSSIGSGAMSTSIGGMSASNGEMVTSVHSSGSMTFRSPPREGTMAAGDRSRATSLGGDSSVRSVGDLVSPTDALPSSGELFV